MGKRQGGPGGCVGAPALHPLLVYNDGARDNLNPCPFTGTVVLDFGQISAKSGSAGYASYGMYDFGPSPWDPLSVVETAARRYAKGWWDATSPCPKLNMVVGVNNYNFCALATTTCSPNGAGQQWGHLIANVQADLNADATSGQVTAWGGGDFETGHNPTGWECATRTTQFTDGYQATGSARFQDFGDAWGSASCWTDSQIYYVAFGEPYDWPFPESYNTNGAAANRWNTVRLNNNVNMDFQGTMTECNVQSDPLPTTTCTVSDSQGTRQENAPNQGWQQFENVDPNATLLYDTNIRFQ